MPFSKPTPPPRFRAATMLRFAFAIAGIAGTALAASRPLSSARLLGRSDALTGVSQETAVIRLLEELTHRYRPGSVAFVGVTVVSPENGSVRRDQTVVVEAGRFTAVGPSSSTRVPRGARIVRDRGWLVPGLTDMHVHSLVSNRQKLLHLINGITTVRDMDGFHHLLVERDAIAHHRLLGPSMLVAGTMLNAVPLDHYARVVTSIDEVRTAIVEQKRAGYDFIKVHNAMPTDLYREILACAHRESLDVVGHIPHDISIADAIGLGQRTLEHFKGYFLDRDLTPTTEDYVALTGGREVWNCPTLYAVRSGISRGELEALIAHSEEMRYVPAAERRRWLAAAKDTRDESSEKIRTMCERFFKTLLAVHARFLTGTDSGGGYLDHVPGFSLQHELEAMDSLGMSPAEVLRSSTTEAAAATRRTSVFGAIAVGLRADALLLGTDPLASIESLRSPEGVLVAGVWLPRAALDEIRSRLAAIYAAPPPATEKQALVLLQRTATNLRGVQARRFPAVVARDGTVDTLASLLIQAGLPHRALPLLERNLEDFPRSSGTRALLAQAALASGDSAAARRSAALALEIDPFDTVAREVLASLQPPADARGEYRFEVRVLARGNQLRSIPVTITIMSPDSARIEAPIPGLAVLHTSAIGDRVWANVGFGGGPVEFAFEGRGNTLRGQWLAEWGGGSFPVTRTTAR